MSVSDYLGNSPELEDIFCVVFVPFSWDERVYNDVVLQINQFLYLTFDQQN